MKNVLFVIGLAALLTSCGGNDSASLKPETTAIKGDLNGCYEVVDKSYKIIEDGISHVVNVELKRTSKELPFDPKSGKFDWGTWHGENKEEIAVRFGCELIDEEGNVVQTIQPGEAGWYGVEYKDIEPLMRLGSEETGTLKIKIDTENKPVKFRILSSIEKSIQNDSDEIVSATAVSEESEVESEESTSSNDWDTVLNEYEKYIDSYIKLYKKAQSGDASALTEYASFLEKAQSLSEELNNAQGELTPSQASRLAKLQQKLANAMM